MIFIRIGKPKPHLRRSRFAVDIFCFKQIPRYAFPRKVYFCPEPLLLVTFSDYVHFGQTPNTRETESHAEKLLNFILSSHLDPIGEQNDV